MSPLDLTKLESVKAQLRETIRKADKTKHTKLGVSWEQGNFRNEWEKDAAEFIADACNTAKHRAEALLVAIEGLQESMKSISPMNNQRCKIILTSILSTFPNEEKP